MPESRRALARLCRSSTPLSVTGTPARSARLSLCQSLPGIAIQSLVGHFVDQTKQKRMLTAAAALVVAAGAAAIAIFPQYWVQILVQLAIGVSVTVFPAATAAFALGMSKKDELSGRVARNETFTHSGNVIFAVVAGLAGTIVALSSIFYAAALFASGMAAAVTRIKQDDVNLKMRVAESRREAMAILKVSRRAPKISLKDKRILIFHRGGRPLQHLQCRHASVNRRNSF